MLIYHKAFASRTSCGFTHILITVVPAHMAPTIQIQTLFIPKHLQKFATLTVEQRKKILAEDKYRHELHYGSSFEDCVDLNNFAMRPNENVTKRSIGLSKNSSYRNLSNVCPAMLIS